MWNLERVLGAIAVVMCGLVGWFKFGLVGIILVFATFVSGCIYCSGNHVNCEEDDLEHDSCDGCKHNLGGGHCRINLEGECREGGGYEAWED